MIYHYEVWQKLFNQYANKIDFKQGVPNVEELKEYQNAFVILDDLMFANAEFLAKIYSVYSHHFQFSMLMTRQNLFHKGLPEISLNSQMIVFFKNCRDTNQIAHFMRQIYPKTYKSALDPNKDAVSLQRGYLLIDLALKNMIEIDCIQGFFQTTFITYTNESLAKKRTHAVVASKRFRTFAKAYSRQSIARVNMLSLRLRS